MNRPEHWAGGVLTIDLAAIRANFSSLCVRIGNAVCTAVVKADAYGLGAARVAPALRDAGCETFFVAHLDEGIALRAVMGADATIVVLHGPPPGAEAECSAHRLLPVLNSLEQVAAWRGHAEARAKALPACLHIDTGMSRLGLSAGDVAHLAEDSDRLRGIGVALTMSHLSCADQPDDPANAAQLAEFQRLRARLPASPASLAASSGIFLGPAWHLDMVRPGAALYGIAPNAAPNPMRPVVRLQGRVAQVRDIPSGTPVGYGATFRAAAAMRVATVSVGYADGFSRAFGNCGAAWLGDARLPIVGRVSMDSLTLDATGTPVTPGALVDLIGPRNPLDAVAPLAGTIGYELLTVLGSRYHRHYVGG